MKKLGLFFSLAFLLLVFTNFTGKSSGSLPSQKIRAAYTITEEFQGISPIDLETGLSGASVQTEHHPKAIAIQPEKQTAYIIQENSNEIVSVNLETGEVSSFMHLDKFPLDILLLDCCESLFVMFEDSPSLAKIDLATGLLNEATFFEAQPERLLAAYQGQVFYVFYNNFSEIARIDPTRFSLQATYELAIRPTSAALSADEHLFYFEHELQQRIHTYHLKTKEINEVATLEKIPEHFGENTQIYLSPDEKYIYLINTNSNEILAVDLELGIQKKMEAGHKIKSLAVYPREELRAEFSKNIAPVGQVSHFDASVTKTFNGNIIDYFWDFGDGNHAFSTTPQVQHIFQNPKQFDVTLTVRESIDNFPLKNALMELIDQKKALRAVSKTSIEVPDEVTGIFAGLTAPEEVNSNVLLAGATSTSISSSAEPAVVGESITFTSIVTSLTDAGIPTGTVDFVDTVLGIIGTGTLDPTGTATYTTSSLVVGTYSLSANYNGDSNYTPSSSAPPLFTQEVNKALTSLAFNAAPNPSTFGNTVTITATLSVVSPGAGTPTGTVTFLDGVTVIGTAPVSGGQAVLMISTLSPGAHSLSAIYGGDANFLTSSAIGWIQTVNQGTTQTILNSSLNPSSFGDSVTFTATVNVTTGVGTPTGTVTFRDGTTVLSTQSLSGGTAAFSTSALAVSGHTITATYNGDANFSSSLSVPVSQVVNQGTTATALTSTVNPSTYGQSTTFTATVSVSTGAGTPTGSVTFRDGVNVLGTSSVVGGNATLSVFNLSVGSHVITATYNGDTNFAGSISPNLSQVVDQAIPIVTIASSLSPSNYGDLVTFTSTVSAPTTLGLPSGTVNFYDGATLIGSGTLSPTGANTATASFSISSLDAGTHPITAQYSGDINFTSATSPILSQVVNPVSSTTVSVFSNSQNSSEYGQPVILRATVTGSTALPPAPPTGFITFFDGGNPIGTVSVTPLAGNPNSSTATLTVSNFTTGPHIITAQYLGDVNYPASPISSPLTHVVTKTPTTSTIATSLTPTVFGQNVTFTITVNSVPPGGGAPSGTVLFYNATDLLGSGTLSPATANSSTATLTTNMLTLGAHLISGIYEGDVNFTSSSTSAITQVVVQDSTSTLITSSSSSPPGFNFGDYITFTAAVTANAPGSGTPTGTVNFYDGATLIATGTLSGGIATGTTFKLYPTPPLHSITAVYHGDTNFTASTSPVFSQAINSTLPTTTTLSSSRNSSPGGASVVYRATVVANPGPGQGVPGIPTGTVTFTDTTLGLVIGTAPLNANGVASITESGANLPFVGPAPDIHKIQATYNGQPSTFDPSTSSLFDQYVVPFDTAVTLVATPNHSTQAGATLVATVTVLNGPPAFPTIGTVDFYEGTTYLGTANVAADGTATLMPDNLHFGADVLTAVYSGDTLQFAMAVSPPVSQQVQQTDMLTTSTTVSSSLLNSIVCQPVTFSAVVVQTQGYYTPTGTVTFFDDGVSIGTSILDGSGRATLTTTELLEGTHKITATYNSDSNYAFSFSNEITQVVGLNATSLNLDIIPNLASTPYGQNLVLSAFVTSTTSYTAIPTGSVTFSAGTTTLGTAEVNENGIATFQISTLDAGNYVITATYVPDVCFLGSSDSQSHTIFKINSQATLSSTPNPSVYGDTILITSSITSNQGSTPTGSVTFYAGATLLGTSFLQGGSASIEVSNLPAGFTVLKATYSGDMNFLSLSTPSVLQTIQKAPTLTCLVSYDTNPSVYGEIVTLSATVSSNVIDDDDLLRLDPVTGNVSFFNGSTLLGTVALNGCNTAELDTSTLSLTSTNVITAQYLGNSNYAPSVSSTLNRTVIKASTTTSVVSITSTPNPPLFGTLVTFNVAVSADYPGSGTPTGTVTGFLGSNSIGTGTLVNGVATFGTSVLPAGNQTIIVKYSGDNNFYTSQTTATETVLPTPTTAAITSSNNPSVYGQAVTFNVTVTSTQGIPTGTVAFLDGTTTLATQTLNNLGAASFTTRILTTGSHAIRVIYTGTANFATSTTSTITQVVNKANTVTTLKSTPNPSVYGQTTVLVANVSPVSPGSGQPTGTVTFRNGATTIGSSPINSAGNASIEITTALAANLVPYSLTAIYSGDGNLNTSTGALSQTITKSATSILTTYSPNPANIGDPVTLNVKVQPINLGVGIPSGTVTALYGSQVVGTGTLSSSGTVTFQTTSLPAGTLGIVIQYQGDANFFASSAPITETINTATSTTTLVSSSNPSLVGQSVTFSASVTTGVGAPTPTGTITFFDGTTILGTQGLDQLGSTTLTVSNLIVGAHAIKAVYSGDGSTNGSTSAILNQIVNQGTASVTLTSILNPSIYGESVTFNAFVGSTTPSAGVPGGTVTFRNGATVLGTVPVNHSGTALLSLFNLPVGTNSITATYNGSTDFAAIVSTPLSQVIGQAPTIISVTSAANPATLGASVPISGKVTALNNDSTLIPTGVMITAYHGSTVLGSGPLDANGNYAFALTNLPAGVLAIELKYPGNANFLSSSVTLTQTVSFDGSAITISSSPNPSIYGQAVTITNVVTLSSGGTPTGTVTYYDGATAIGTTDVNQPFSISTLSVGTHAISAVYSGSTNIAGSNSNTINQVVNKVPAAGTTTTILSGIPNPSVFGEPVNFLASVNSPNGNPTGTVTFYDGITPLATVPLYDGFAVFPISSLSVGIHDMTAVYNGDANFSPSLPSPVYLQVVNPVTITITTVTTLTSSLNPSNYGDPVTFDIQITSAAIPPPTPTGFVTLYLGALPLVTLALDSTAHASYTTSNLPAGDLQIVALYSGDSNFSASTTVILQVVNELATTTTLTSTPNPSNFGTFVSFTATVTSTTASIPQGTVSFYDGANLLQTVLLNSMGVANYTTASLSTGNHLIDAVYNPRDNFNSSSDSLLQTVNLSPTTTTIVGSTANPANYGSSVTFTAFTSSSNNTPSGIVNFYDGSTYLGSGLVVNGFSFFTTSTLSPGTHEITAVYVGDTNNAGSTSAPFIQIIINQADVLQSPRGFCGCPIPSNFLNKSYYSILLTWSPPGTGAEPEFYRIYRDANLTELVATIYACSPTAYVDSKLKRNGTYTYYLVAGNQIGISSPVTVSVGPDSKNCCSIK